MQCDSKRIYQASSRAAHCILEFVRDFCLNVCDVYIKPDKQSVIVDGNAKKKFDKTKGIQLTAKKAAFCASKLS